MNKMNKMKEYLAFNMCDFCSNEITSCKATPIFSKSLTMTNAKIEPDTSVIACDKYKNPVDSLKKQFQAGC